MTSQILLFCWNCNDAILCFVFAVVVTMVAVKNIDAYFNRPEGNEQIASLYPDLFGLPGGAVEAWTDVARRRPRS